MLSSQLKYIFKLSHIKAKNSSNVLLTEIEQDRTIPDYFSKDGPRNRGPPRILIQIIILAIVPSDYIQKREEKKEKREKKEKEESKKERNGTKHNEHLITGGQNPSHKSLRSVIEFLLRRRIEGTSLVSLLFPP